MPAPEESPSGKRRRVRSFKDVVSGSVYDGFLASCKVAPEQEDHTVAVVGDVSDDCIREFRPTDIAVR